MNYSRTNTQNPVSSKQAACATAAAAATSKAAVCDGENCNQASCAEAMNTHANPTFDLARNSIVGAPWDGIVFVVIGTLPLVFSFRDNETIALSVLCLSAIAVVTIGAIALMMAARPNNKKAIAASVCSMRALLSGGSKCESCNHTDGIAPSPNTGGRP